MEILAFCAGIALLCVGFGVMCWLFSISMTYIPGENYRNTTRIPSDPPMWTYSKTTTMYKPAPTEGQNSSEHG